MIRPACGLQKQSCPAQAATVLYLPMTNRPPSAEITDHSASPRTQPRPNHSPRASAVPHMTVSSASYQVPNRFSRAHPAAPVVTRGGLASVSL